MDPQASTVEQGGAESQVAAAPRGRGGFGLAVLALMSSGAALAAVVHAGGLVRGQRDEIASLRATVAELQTAQDRLVGATERLGSAVTLLSDEQIDLMNPKLQHLRHGFAVSEIKLERKENGVLVFGRIINATSLRHRGATFRLKVGASSKEFTIPVLPSGVGGEFGVELANLPLENARIATLSLVSSGVEYDR